MARKIMHSIESIQKTIVVIISFILCIFTTNCLADVATTNYDNDCPGPACPATIDAGNDSDSSSSGAYAGGSGGSDSYTVLEGDTLWGISAKNGIYFNPYQWPLIYKTNRSKILDADIIYPGQVFDIDQNASASEIDAAVFHAKTRGTWLLFDTEKSDRDYLAY